MKKILLASGILFCGLALGGCYTVLHSPHLTSSAVPAYGEAEEAKEAWEEPERSQEEWRDLYSYPGSLAGYGSAGYGGSYGYGGYPLVLSSGYYGYAPDSYSRHYGYGPYSYGYDPYYRDAYGYYIPAGYKLITEAELDALRAGLTDSGQQEEEVDPEEQRLRELQEQRQAEEVWERRTQPRVRVAPQATPRTTTPAASGTSSTYTPRSTEKSSGSSSGEDASSSDSEDKGSARPRKRRR